MGMHPTESFLCILYMSKLFHPDDFQDLDMVDAFRGYYVKFYNYDLTRGQAKRILASMPPDSQDH